MVIFFKKWIFRSLSVTCVSLVTICSFAADSAYISVGTAKTKKAVMAVAPFVGGSDSAWNTSEKIISDTLTSDLTFTDLFRFIGSSAFLEKSASGAGVAPNTFDMKNWTSIGVEFLIKGKLTVEGSTQSLEAYLYDSFGAKQILAKRYVSPVKESKILAHTLANDIVKALTGEAGIFLTKIVTSCDRTKKKELYLMDFDGTNVKQITEHRSISFAPAWSPDNSKIVYSVYTKKRDNVKNIDLYELNFNQNTVKMLSNKKGINSGATFSPDGNKIALTMSFLGNPEIFSLDPATSSVTRLTKSLGMDVDPSWSPDGKWLAFVSSRSGMPMVYKMDSNGDKAERLTYAGRYNATPSWSPDGKKIAFSGWIDKKFDVFTMNIDGSSIERLTKNMGNNEDPSWSPDGNFIVFSSNRAGSQNIYIMNRDGSYVKRLTFGLGNCVSPKWSNRL